MSFFTKRSQMLLTALLLMIATPLLAGGECCQERNQHCRCYMDPCCPDPCFAPVAGLGPVGIAPCYAYDMLSRLHYLSIKPLVLLNYRKCNPCNQSVILSAQLEASGFYTFTSTRDKFPYLGQNPFTFSGHTGSVFEPKVFNVGLTYSPLCWTHVYWEFFNDDQNPFSGDPRQITNQTRQIFAIVGNFECSPFFATIGKRNIPFGQLYTVNPFTTSMTAHIFQPIAEGASIGYYNGCLYLEAMAINGGRGIRVADTFHEGDVSNFAFNGRYETKFCDVCVKLGAGYIYATLYNGVFPEHIGPPGPGRNGAWDVSLELQYCNWRGFFEFASTEHKWPTTNTIVRTFTGGVSYCLRNPCFCYPVTLSAEYGEVIFGPKHTEIRRAFQGSAGFDVHVRKNIRFIGEWVIAGGFQPLPLLLVPGVADNGTVQNLFRLGLRFTI